MPVPSFRGDAMLMMGWVADADLRVTEINDALAEWCSANGIGFDVGTPLNKFLDALLDQPRDGDLGEMLFDRLRRLKETIASGALPDTAVEEEASYRFFQTTALGGDAPRGGIRIVRPGGIQFRTGRLQDRFDFVAVVLAERDDTCVRVTGFQGQFQEAWSRAEPVLLGALRDRAMVVATRNLSHNLGSHLLFAMRTLGAAEWPSIQNHQLVYAYLQDRMELLAALGVGLDLGRGSCTLKEVVKEFNKLAIVSQYLCEGIDKIELTIEGDACSLEVIIPDWPLGRHAIFAILENVARDAAPAALAAGRNCVKLVLQCSVDEACPGLVRVCIRDPLGTERAKAALCSALEDVRLEDGAQGWHFVKLTSTPDGWVRDTPSWGVLERFIWALFLRGGRLQNKSLVGTADLTLTGGLSSLGEILGFAHGNDGLDTTFWLEGAPPEIISVGLASCDHDAAWLGDSIARGRRWDVGRFLVLSRDVWEANKARMAEGAVLPRRCVVVGSSSLSAPDRLKAISASLALGTAVNPVQLEMAWFSKQTSGLQVAIAIVDDRQSRAKLQQLDVPGAPASMWWVSPDRLSAWLEQHKANERIGVSVHQNGVLSGEFFYYEASGYDDPLGKVIRGLLGLVECNCEYQFEAWRFAADLVEAALTPVLVVDERLSRTWDQQRGGITYSRMMEDMRVRLVGREYFAEQKGSGDLIEEIEKMSRPQDSTGFLVIHRKIIDRMARKEGSALAPLVAKLVKAGNAGMNVVLHSGAMTNAMAIPGVRVTSLAKIDQWVARDAKSSKARILGDLHDLPTIV